MWINIDAANGHADERRQGRERRWNCWVDRKLIGLRHVYERIGERAQDAGQADGEREIRIVEQLRVSVARREPVVVDAIAAARDERAALVQAISEADARRKIIFVGRDQTIVDERHAGQRIRRVACLHKTVRRLRGRCSCARAELCWIEVDEATTYVNRIAVEVVAQAEVQRQTAAELVVVLHEAVEVVHAQRAIIDARTDDRDAAADEKAAEVGEDDLPA